MDLDPAHFDRAATYRLFISLLAPRPVAWVGTTSASGVDNLAPFSYFMGVGSAPPMVAFSVARARGGALKDTARNVLETGVLTISMVEERQLNSMHATSAPWPGSEFDAVNVPRAQGRQVRAPYVADARVVLEGRLAHTLDLEQTHLFVVEIVWMHIADELLRDGVVDLDQYRPIARLGGDAYTTLGSVVHLPVAKVP